MRVRVADIKRIIKEEAAGLEEKGSFLGQFSTTSARQKPRGVRTAPDSDDQFVAPVITDPKADARDALQAVYQALKAFNPRWHRMVCQSRAGKEMADVVIKLEQELGVMSRLLGESYTIGDIRALIREEMVRMDEFLGQFNTPRTSDRRTPHKSQKYAETTPSDDFGKGGKLAWTLPRIRRSVTDFLTLYDTFTPKVRRKMCLGAAGDELATALQTLDDMIAKLLEQ